jgi:uncharacterized membrane protein YbaN (DUF454 family)
MLPPVDDETPAGLLTGPKGFIVHGLGHVFLLLGLVGVLLPIVPTLPFLVVAGACWARTSPRFHGWLMNHAVFGPPLREWALHRSLPMRTKLLTAAGIACAGAVSLLFLVPEGTAWLVSFGVVSTMVVGTLLIPTRRPG